MPTSCPRLAREIVVKAAERLKLHVCLVANQPVNRHHSPLITSVHVHDGFAAANDRKPFAATLDRTLTRLTRPS